MNPATENNSDSVWKHWHNKADHDKCSGENQKKADERSYGLLLKSQAQEEISWNLDDWRPAGEQIQRYPPQLTITETHYF